MRKAKFIIYWATTVLIAAVFVGSGIANLISVPHIVQDLIQLGYPTYFHIILGVWKILAGIAIIIPRTPRLKEWAYAGMVFDLTGAAFSRYSSGDGTVMVLVPFAICCFVAMSWTFRPQSRVLINH